MATLLSRVDKGRHTTVLTAWHGRTSREQSATRHGQGEHIPKRKSETLCINNGHCHGNPHSETCKSRYNSGMPPNPEALERI